MGVTYINSYIYGGDPRILLSATPGPSATITTYSGYIVFKFNATGTLNVGAGTPGTADVFVVGGGSSGANGTPGDAELGGTGGTGGSRNESPAVAIIANSPIPIVVGSTATASSFGPLSSSGGTSGGAGGISYSAVPAQPGSNGPSNSYETGSPQQYGGGGGGGGASRPSPYLNFSTLSGGSGGLSGGGSGGSGGARRTPNPLFGDRTPGTPGIPGVANTGGGGGGGGANFPVGQPGGTGGSGVVIARFPDTQFRTS